MKPSRTTGITASRKAGNELIKPTSGSIGGKSWTKHLCYALLPFSPRLPRASLVIFCLYERQETSSVGCQKR